MIYKKLVRDKIPDIIKKSGMIPIVEIINDDTYYNLLKTKLYEEYLEFKHSEEINELADIVEVIYAILDYKNISIEQFEKIRKGKIEDRGAFKDKIFLIETLKGEL